MSLTSDSGACSVSSSDGGGRDDTWEDPEEEEEEDEEECEEDVDEEEEEVEVEVQDKTGSSVVSSRIDDGIEFVNDVEAAAAAAAAAAAVCGYNRGPCGRRSRRGPSEGGRRQQTNRGSGGGRAYSHQRERVRRERFIELYGKLQSTIPTLQLGKRVTHRRILTETAAYLASTIAQIKARRRVSRLRALLAQLESDAAYMRRLSGVPHQQRQHQPYGQFHYQYQQHQQNQHQQHQQHQQQLPDVATPNVLAIGDCFLIG